MRFKQKAELPSFGNSAFHETVF